MDKERELQEITDVAMAMAQGDFSRGLSVDVKGELGKLAFFIDKVRTNLQILQPGVKESTENIPMVRDGLRSVTRAAEEGTHRVITLSENMLDDCDRIDEMATLIRAEVPEPLHAHIDTLQQLNEKHKGDLLDVLTALSFQDLTGQRLKKLEELIVEIESRILQLLVAFGISMDRHPSDSDDVAGQADIRVKAESHIQSLRKGDLDQDLIDSILDEFGS